MDPYGTIVYITFYKLSIEPKRREASASQKSLDAQAKLIGGI
jgi:hypothetical protein